MKHIYSKRSPIPLRIRILGLILLMVFSTLARAQEGSQGNTTIFGGGEMTFFGNHNFLSGGNGSQPGIILTERAASNLSYLNFSGNNLTSSGGSNSGYVDGYVRKYGTGQFIFPVGDNGIYAPFVALVNGTSGAYFNVNPGIAATSNLFTGGTYPALPVGGPFPTTNRATFVGAVSTVEYWDIDGSTATPITLTWNAGSSLSALTGNSLSKLRIVGWNSATARWELIPSSVDATSVLGGPSSLTSGSITSTNSIVPNSYTVYTFARLILPDLTPAQFFSDTQLSIGETVDYVAAISNVGPETTVGEIEFRITNFGEATGLSITLNPAYSVTIDGDQFILNNNDFNITTSSTRFSFTSKSVPPISIPSSGVKYIGFKITRIAGSNGSLNNTVTITNGTGGGETPVNNNTIANPITKN